MFSDDFFSLFAFAKAEKNLNSIAFGVSNVIRSFVHRASQQIIKKQKHFYARISFVKLIFINNLEETKTFFYFAEVVVLSNGLTNNMAKCSMLYFTKIFRFLISICFFRYCFVDAQNRFSNAGEHHVTISSTLHIGLENGYKTAWRRCISRKTV